jgi:3-deoxy-D-manno-octulosonic-acid transferase
MAHHTGQCGGPRNCRKGGIGTPQVRSLGAAADIGSGVGALAFIRGASIDEVRADVLGGGIPGENSPRLGDTGSVNRTLYTLLLRLLALGVLLHQAWQSWREPKYRGRWLERWGYGAPVVSSLDGPIVWLHAVSVGEVQAAVPLVRALLQQTPPRRLVLTTTTATGARRVAALFGEAVEHRFLPLDYPGAVARFLDRVQPACAVVLETEIWPNLYAECLCRGIPLTLASARLSVRTIATYRRLRGLFAPALGSGGVTVLAQSAADAARYLELGALPAQCRAVGNLKFELEIPVATRAVGRAWHEQWAGASARFIWVAGSTHEGEEQVLLAAHGLLRQTVPDALLVLVPRHPQRFAAAAANVQAAGLPYVARSQGGHVGAGTAVLLGDTLGELLALYAAADAAFVGGSLVPVGGHNLLEPAALGLPVLSGRQVFNAPDVAAALAAAGALEWVDDVTGLCGSLQALAADAALRQRRGLAAVGVVDANRGALRAILEAIG